MNLAGHHRPKVYFPSVHEPEATAIVNDFYCTLILANARFIEYNHREVPVRELRGAGDWNNHRPASKSKGACGPDSGYRRGLLRPDAPRRRSRFRIDKIRSEIRVSTLNYGSTKRTGAWIVGQPSAECVWHLNRVNQYGVSIILVAEE